MNLKDRWDSLLERERKIVLLGGAAVAIIFFYMALWSPLSDAVADSKVSVHSKQSLLQFLKTSAQRIAQFKAEGVSVTTAAHVELLTLVEQTLSTQQLSTYLKQVQQPKPTQIALTFQNVPFDKLMQWLQMLSTSHNVSVVQFSAVRSPTLGTAMVTVTLAVSKQG